MSDTLVPMGLDAGALRRPLPIMAPNCQESTVRAGRIGSLERRYTLGVYRHYEYVIGRISRGNDFWHVWKGESLLSRHTTLKAARQWCDEQRNEQ